jgi:hypothetical protein
MTPRIKTLADVQPDVLYAITELSPLIGASYTSLWREVRETGRLVGFELAGGIRIRGSDFMAPPPSSRSRAVPYPSASWKSCASSA